MAKSLLRTVVLAVSILAFGGCGTAPMQYEPSTLNLEQAMIEVEKLIMTQHPAWRPDYVHFDRQYLFLGFGTRTTGSGSGAVIGNAVFGSGSARTRNVGERLYFENVKSVSLRSWNRKMKQWYAVSVQGFNDQHVGYILRTRDLEGAKRFVDGMTVILAAYYENPEGWLPNVQSAPTVSNIPEGEDEAKSDFYTQLLELADLRDRGILSEDEFEAQKSKLLEND